MSEPVLRHDEARRRYELAVDGQTVGIMDYRTEGNTVNVVHTEVPPQHGGKGFGSALAQRVLADLRSRGIQVRASCDFMAKYIARHPAG